MIGPGQGGEVKKSHGLRTPEGLSEAIFVLFAASVLHSSLTHPAALRAPLLSLLSSSCLFPVTQFRQYSPRTVKTLKGGGSPIAS